MKQGALIFDERTDRYDIRFDLADYYGGLPSGDGVAGWGGGGGVPAPGGEAGPGGLERAQ